MSFFFRRYRFLARSTGSGCHDEIPLLVEEILLHYIVYISISRIPVLIVSRCMRGHVASCCRKEGSMQKNQKKCWEKQKANEIKKGYRDVTSLSYRMVMSFRFCS